VLLVGEMRDLESIHFALTIAETVHLVFATLATNDSRRRCPASSTSSQPEQQAQVRTQLSAALTAIVYHGFCPESVAGLVGAL